MRSDLERAKALMNAINSNGFRTNDRASTYTHFKDKTKGMKSYDYDFNYPNEGIEIITNLHKRCGEYRKSKVNCEDDCQRHLTRWPALKPTQIHYKIITFEREQR